MAEFAVGMSLFVGTLSDTIVFVAFVLRGRQLAAAIRVCFSFAAAARLTVFVGVTLN